MTYFSSPSFSRRRRAAPKLKLIVSFNGKFRRLPPFQKLRYTGGETRIISVDRGISFSKLNAKIITDIVRPSAAAFSGFRYSLKYRVSDSFCGGDGLILTPLETDGDVRRMVEEYEEVEFRGKFRERLWLFVCDNRNDHDNNGSVSAKLGNLSIESDGFYQGRKGFAGIQGNQSLRWVEGFLSEEQKGSDGKAIHHRCKKFNDDCLRKTVLRQQLFAKKFDSIRGLRVLDELTGDNGDSESTLTDSSSEPESPPSFLSENMNTCGDLGRKVTDYNYVNSHEMAHADFQKVFPVTQSNNLPLNSNDGNLKRESDGSRVFFPGLSLKIFGGESTCNSLESPSETAAAGQPPKQSNYSGASSNGHGLEANCDLKRACQALLSCKNEKNIMPCCRCQDKGEEVDGRIGCGPNCNNKMLNLPFDRQEEITMKTGKDVSSNSSSEKAAKAGKDEDEKQEIQQGSWANLSMQEKGKNETMTRCLKANGSNLATGELQNIGNSDLEFIKELGSGTFGTVYHGKWKGSDVAIKRIKSSCFTDSAKEVDRLVADFWKEAHILGQLRHPNIVAMYGVASDGPLDSLAAVTEYMVNGSLKQVLCRKDRTIDRRKRLLIAMDATSGMEYLHEKNIVHFDLKSDNFFVNMKDPHRPVCKIGDFGLSKIKQRTLVSGGVRGTLPWMAPELLNGNTQVSEKVDVYSFAIVMWELLTGEEPYEQMRSEAIIAGIIRGDLRPEVPSWCDPAWRSLMERCWSSHPDSRPPFSEIAKELRAMAASMNIK